MGDSNDSNKGLTLTQHVVKDPQISKLVTKVTGLIMLNVKMGKLRHRVESCLAQSHVAD